MSVSKEEQWQSWIDQYVQPERLAPFVTRAKGARSGVEEAADLADLVDTQSTEVCDYVEEMLAESLRPHLADLPLSQAAHCLVLVMIDLGV